MLAATLAQNATPQTAAALSVRQAKMKSISEEINCLNGKWRQIYVNENGVDNPISDDGLGTISEFYNGKFIVFSETGERVLEGTFLINPSASPAEIDWSDTIGPDLGKTFPSIYRLSNDSFEFCAADEGMERPRKFEARVGHTIRHFIRVNANA